MTRIFVILSDETVINIPGTAIDVIDSYLIGYNEERIVFITKLENIKEAHISANKIDKNE